MRPSPATRVGRFVHFAVILSLAGSLAGPALPTVAAAPPAQGEVTETPGEPPPTETSQAGAIPDSADGPDSNATPAPSETAAATDTPAPGLSPTPSAAPLAGAPTSTETLPAGLTPTAAGTPPAGPLNSGPAVRFEFSVSPQRAAPGEAVLFTVTITNAGQRPETNVTFINTLPPELRAEAAGLGALSLDTAARSLTWHSAALAPGERVQLQYAAAVAAQAGATLLVVDAADLRADGWAAPLQAETTLVVAPAGEALLALGRGGGRIDALGGRLHLSAPAGAVEDGYALRIRDVTAAYPAPPGEAWVAFEVETLGDAARAQADAWQPATDRTTTLNPVELPFGAPVEMTFSYDGLADLAALGAAYEPFVVTLDEVSGVWVRAPLKGFDRDANTVTVETRHFSTWGAGLGPSTPQNGANIPLFDSAFPNLFTGRAQYSVPIWTPPGRGGMAPALALSYSSGAADGLLGDVQAPWAGMGWSIETVEILRKITNGNCNPCGGSSYGYKNEFTLTFNGAGGRLKPDPAIPGRYHTESESFLYIQLHSVVIDGNPSAANASGEWWEIVTRDGTRWRLGYNADAEQLAAMKGYPGDNIGTWKDLGSAGRAQNAVAYRWRADRATDTHGNTITFAYFEETRAVDGTANTYDRASYLDTITYPGLHTIGFVREARPAGTEKDPSPKQKWDNYDYYRLDKIEIRYDGATVVRAYDLDYEVLTHSDDGSTWRTTVLTALTVSGTAGAQTARAPTMTFAYEFMDNRADTSAGPEWAYPRLTAIGNGWGGTAAYLYQHDSRPNTAWYNWRVQKLTLTSGVSSGIPLRTTFAYQNPCYRREMDTSCNTNASSELVGYGQVDETRLDANQAAWATITHKFHRSKEKAGREYETLHANAGGAILAKTTTTFVDTTAGLPPDVFFVYAGASEAFALQGGALQRVSKSEYTYEFEANGRPTGNLILEKQYDGAPALYRQVEREYVTHTAPAGWQIVKLRRETVKDAAGSRLAETLYAYDGTAAGLGTVGDLTLVQVVDPSTTATPTATAAPTATPTPPPADLIFADGFEAGGFSAWSTVVSDGGDLSASAAAAILGSYGLQAVVNDKNSIRVEDDTPDGEARYRARYYFDPNGIAFSCTSCGYDVLYSRGPGGAGNGAVDMNFQWTGSVYRIRAETRDDSAVKITSAWVEISNDAHMIEIDWMAATAPGANNGRIAVWLDGEFKNELTGIDNDAQRVETMLFGVASTIVGNAAGTVYYDEFESRRATYIGPPPTPSPTPTAPPTPLRTIDTAHVYDPHGNVVKTCNYGVYGASGYLPEAACGATSGDFQATTFGYDASATYVITATNALGHQTATAYQWELGLPAAVTDPNGNVTQTTYDALGRVQTVTYPGYTQANVAYFYPTPVSGSVGAPFALRAEILDDGATPAVVRVAHTVYDGLGRALQSQGPAAASGDLLVADTAYDAQGLVHRSGLPRQLAENESSRVAINNGAAYYYPPAWASVPHTTSAYDALNRPTALTFADNTQQRTFYDGLQTTFVDQNNRQRAQAVDSFGRLVAVQEYTGVYGSAALYATTTYEYTRLDALAKVTDALGNETLIGYDGFGRKVNMSDPDMGQWTYAHDAFGNLASQTDARGVTLSFEYDALNRLWQKWEGAIGTGTLLATMTYDSGPNGVGRRTGMEDLSGSTDYAYDAQGRLISQSQNINGVTGSFALAFAYDAVGRLASVTYPTGEVVEQSYDASGRLAQVASQTYSMPYASGMIYNALGQLRQMTVGPSANGVTTYLDYYGSGDPWGGPNSFRLWRNRTVQGGATRFDMQYGYDEAGNVNHIWHASAAEDLVYEYDALDRLTAVSGAYNETYEYDQIGNLTQKGNASYTYPAGGQARPHAMSGRSDGWTYEYDANGNAILRVEKPGATVITYTHTYNADNLLATTTTGGQTTTYLYDGDGNRVLETDGAGVTTVMIGKWYEKNLTADVETVYYYAGNQRIALRTISSSGSTVYYLLTDHLGSTSVTLDANGNKYGELRYQPYGSVRYTWGATPTDLRYTGQRLEQNVALIDYGARFYKPWIGRFIQPDPIVPQPGNPQALNRYAYVLNNPLKYTDPSGHAACCQASPKEGQLASAKEGQAMGRGRE